MNNLKVVTTTSNDYADALGSVMDIYMTPVNRERNCAYIIEFKVHKPRKEKDLQETVANALSQMEEKQYEATLMDQGFAPTQIKK